MFSPTKVSTTSDVDIEHHRITFHPNFNALHYIHTVMFEYFSFWWREARELWYAIVRECAVCWHDACDCLTNLVLILDAPNRSRPASSLTSSPASVGEGGTPSVFGGLHFGPGRKATDQPSNLLILQPAPNTSGKFGSLRVYPQSTPAIPINGCMVRRI